jgi:ABC-type nitrate/sulfonate/bicarbonate transport system permease component
VVTVAALEKWPPTAPDWLRNSPVRPGRVFGVALFVVGWYALATVFPARLMPYPDELLAPTWELIRTGVVWRHLGSTLYRTLWGFVGTMILGTGIGIVMGVNNYGQRFLIPQVILWWSIPAIAWAAIASLIFGFSDMAPIFATVVVVFPLIAINVWKGVEEVDGDLIRMSKSFGVSNRRLLFRMLIPNTAPSLFAAVRLGLATAWKIVTIAEIFSASRGVGYKLIQAYEAVQYDLAWTWALVFMVVILLIEYGVFRPLEERVFEYRQDADISVV